MLLFNILYIAVLKDWSLFGIAVVGKDSSAM